MRFRWWLDAISNLYKGRPPGNPVFTALHWTLQSAELTRHRLKTIVETRMADAMREQPYETLSQLEGYADGTAGQLMQLQLEAAGVMENGKEVAAMVGKGVGLTNVLRGTPHHATRGVHYFPQELLDAFRVSHTTLLAKKINPEIRSLARRCVEHAELHLAEARGMRGEVPSAAQKLLLPATVAETYLAALRRYDHCLDGTNRLDGCGDGMIGACSFVFDGIRTTLGVLSVEASRVYVRNCHIILITTAPIHITVESRMGRSCSPLTSSGIRRLADVNSSKPAALVDTKSKATRVAADPSVMFESSYGVHQLDRFPEVSEPPPLQTVNVADNKMKTPVFAMLPLDTVIYSINTLLSINGLQVNKDGSFTHYRTPWFHEALRLLVSSGVTGVAVDVWWGVVEKSPGVYDWGGYRDLFNLIQPTGLRMQIVLSFHACGGNVGDVVEIPLPEWVLQCGEMDPDIFMCDCPRMHQGGQRNRECISIFADDIGSILCGRSPMQCYADFMSAFRDEFDATLGSFVTDIVIGAGPCGELRYPSYSETNGWRFPGIGEFQCYDRYALAALAQAAVDIGRPNWGYAGPHDAGHYNNRPNDAHFFMTSGSWETPYGDFFLTWYSDALLRHGRRLLETASIVFAAQLSKKTSSSKSMESFVDSFAWLTKIGGRLCGSPSTASVTDVMVSEGSVTGPTPSFTSMPRDTSLDSIAKDTIASCNSFQSGDACPEFSVFDVETGAFAPMKLSPIDASPSSESGSHISRWDTMEFLRRFGCRNPSHNPSNILLNLKIAGVHWWYRTRSHAAELTAGYYNAGERCGYEPIVQLCQEFNCGLTLTCIEMSDDQHPSEICCSPQGLLHQIRHLAAAAGIRFGGENALPLFYPGQGANVMGLDRVADRCRSWINKGIPGLQSFTFLRVGPEILHPFHKSLWNRFMQNLQERPIA